MSKRTKTAIADFTLRLREPMRARIERAAKDRGLSMNGEITDRLETTFTKEELFDRLFGGPEMRRLAVLYAATFEHGARLGRYLQHGTPIDSPADQKEFTDPTTGAYREGLLAAVQALMNGMPEEAKATFIKSLIGRSVSDAINKRRLAKGVRPGAGQ